MPSQAVQRISIRWLPDAAYEDTDTVALNVGGYFIDLRVVKDSGAIQWSRAGERIVLKEDPPTFRWTHIIDSLDLTIPDDAHFEKLPNGDDLEIGTYPLGGVPTDYEEIWRDITQKKSPEELSWILQSSDGSAFIGKVGGIFLAIQKTQGGFAARREDRDVIGDAWKLTFEDGAIAGLPTATQGSEAIETQDSRWIEGQTIEIGGIDMARISDHKPSMSSTARGLLEALGDQRVGPDQDPWQILTMGISISVSVRQSVPPIYYRLAAPPLPRASVLSSLRKTCKLFAMASSPTDSIQHSPEKGSPSRGSGEDLKTEVIEDGGEVFQQAEYRALGWIRTAIILSKLCFATGVLAIPSAFSIVGYGPGIILLVCWGALTTYYAYIMYAFRMRYSGVHNIADAAGLMGGPIAREVAGGLFLLTWILATGSGFIGLAQGFQVLSSKHVCTVVWTLVAAICTALVASIQTLGKLAILTWIGFASIFTAVFIVVVGVTQVDRPAAAPQEGSFDMEVLAVGAPTFIPGFVAAINLFAGYGSTPTFMPVIAEMKTPKSFTKALFSSQGFLVACYISFALVVYMYCGQYVASPSLGSAGGTLEKIAYGVSIPGFIMTSTLWVHLAAKFLLVRILRNSEHLQNHSLIHWTVWLGSTIGISTVAFIIAGAVPFFSYLIGLIGSLCCAPTCLIIPAFMGLYMDWELRGTSKVKQALCYFHIFTVVLGAFMTVTGTYTTIQSIIDAYKLGTVGTPFTCS